MEADAQKCRPLLVYGLMPLNLLGWQWYLQLQELGFLVTT